MRETAGALERLSALAGVATTYEDVFGTTHAAPAETLRRVLGTLGFDAASDDAAERAGDALEASRWRAALEPIYVFDAEAPALVTFSQPAGRPEDVRRWSLRMEDGSNVSGSFAPHMLDVLERRTIDGRDYERRAFALPPGLDIGYHRLTLHAAGCDVEATIAIAPATCWIPESVQRRGVWGLAIQLYALRSERDWGIGDFTDLAALGACVADAGGAAIGLNPLHALHARDGTSPSPYSPTSRTFVNWIYLDVAKLPGYDATDVDGEALARVRASEFVDYPGVAKLKRHVARAAFERFRASARDADAGAFDAFVAAEGEPLQRAATFAALVERFEGGPGTTADWASWPDAFRDPCSEAVRSFARERAHDVAFFAYLEWQAQEQLAACARVAPQPIGLYRDLAVGADLGGSDTWAMRETMTREAAVGAPPDVLNVSGQNWGVAPFDPLALRRAAYAPFVALLRANMRHAGALRIDHAMALARLYWVPAGSPATDGAYVAYPLDDLLAIVALESRRARCMVIGEDLGTVPAGFREKLQARGVLSYRLLPFERDDDGFHPPESYPELALVSLATHDLPPLGAYWTGSDIATRARLGLLGDDEAREREARAREREQLLRALARTGLAERDERRFRDVADKPDDRETLAEIALAANRYLARSPGRLLMVQLEDVFGDVAQANVPTTTVEHPNWRRRASVRVEDLAADTRFVALAHALRDERGSVQAYVDAS